MNTQAIWYITFQSPTLSGSGLATYCREVIKAAKIQNRSVRFYYVDPKATHRSETTDGLVSIVTVPGVAASAYRDFGPYMYQSLAIARAVLADLKQGMRPLGIECPDGYALGYYLLQYKRTLHPALRDIPITLVAHTPIGVIDEWIGLEPYRSPEWWMYRAEKWCFLACDTVITYSDMLENTLRAKGYLPGHVPVVRQLNPFSVSDIVKRPDHIEAPQPVVVMASQMLNWKGLPHAISLAQALDATGSSMRVELLGSNPTLPGKTASQVDLMKAAHPDLFATNRLAYKGTLTHEELATQRKSWHCQIHPSKYDNFPYSVLECLAQGTSCLMTSGNGVSECLPDDLAAALVVDFEAPQEVIAALENLPNPQALINGIDWSQFDSAHYFAGRDTLFADLATQTQISRQFPFIQNTDQGKRSDQIIAENTPQSSRVSLAREETDTEFVALTANSPSQEYLNAALAVLDQYDNVGFVGSWSNQSGLNGEESQRIRPSYNAEPMPNILFEDATPNTLIIRHPIWSRIKQDDPTIAPEVRDWDRLLSMLGDGHYGVMLPTPLHEATPIPDLPDPVLWRRNYNQLVQKHEGLFAKNIVALTGFVNANGADVAYRLTTQDLSLYTRPKAQGRLKPLHRVARSVARKLTKFAEKGAR